jgi:membrane-anchored protein YejM (alkaline phosphatase superfamily)
MTEIMRSDGRVSRRLAERLDLLWLALLNAALITGLFLANAGTLLRTVKAQPSVEDRALLAFYTLAVMLGAALAAYAAVSLLPGGRRMLAPRIAALAAATLGVVLAMVDIKVFSVLGVHLYDPLVLSNLRNRHIDAELSLGTGTVLAIVGFVVAAAAGQVLALRQCRRVCPADERRRRAALHATIFWTLAILGPSAIVAGYLVRPALRHGSLALAALPGYQVLFAPPSTQRPLEVCYPALPQPAPTLRQRPDILLMVAESFRADVLTADLAPNLWRFQNEHGTIQSAHHSAGCHVTEFGLFSVLYGLGAFHYSPFLQGRTQSLPLQILQANGYELLGASAAPMAEWNYAEFMFESFDEYREFFDQGPERNDQLMVDWLCQRLSERRGERPRLLFVFFNATHHNYHYPAEFERFLPVFPQDHNYFMETDRLASSRTEIFNRYKNSVGYVDHLCGRLLESFRRNAAGGEPIILFTGDHGEEFWEHQLLGHSATRFVNERTQVPLVLSLPGQAARRVPLSCHTDIMPTILDFAGVQGSLPLEAYASGWPLLQPQPPGRHILICGAGFPYSNELLCVMTPHRKHWLRKTDSGLADLQRLFSTDVQDRPAPEEEAAPQPALIQQVRSDLYRFLKEEL